MGLVQIKKRRSLHPVPLFHCKYMEKQWKQWQTLFSWAPESLQIVTAAVEKKKKKTLAPWNKSYGKPWQHTKKQRHYFASKCLYSQTYGFSRSHERTWELDHKKAEHQKIDAFELCCWTRLLRVPWTGRRSNQSILKEISPEYSLEEPMLKLNLHYFDQLMGRTDSL